MFNVLHTSYHLNKFRIGFYMGLFWYNLGVIFSTAVPAISAICLVFLVRRCRDNLCIYTEFKYLAILLASFIICYICFALPLELNTNSRYIVLTFLSSIHTFMGNILFTCMPLHWYRKAYEYTHIMRIRSISEGYRWTLIQVLENEDGFEMFAEYLIKEFAIEVWLL